MRLATIDIGTNTAQLLVVAVENEEIRRLHTAERFVRLGEGVDAENRIGPAAQERLLATLREHIRVARHHDVDRIVAAGTSALRDAANRQVVLDAVREACGLDVDIFSGKEEATWSFAAACAPLDDLAGSCLVVDVGGGSTELIAGTDPTDHHPRYVEAITDRTSLDVGCVRLTERCFSAQPPVPESVRQADRLIDDALQDANLSAGSEPTLIGTAGTATALAFVHAGPDSTWDALHGDAVVLSHTDVHRWRTRLLDLSVNEIHALHPEAMEGRADVFPVGVMLLDRILTHFDLQALRVSPYELRHGLALRWLSRGG